MTALADDLIDDDEKVASQKIYPAQDECKNHILFTTKIDTLFMTKIAEKPYPLGPKYLYRPYEGALPRALVTVVAHS